MDREKELFEWIRGMYREMRPEDKKDAERFFPELAESEDERIRKELIDLFRDCINNRNHPYNASDSERWIAYLEKQKSNIELIQRSWYMEGYHDREFGQEPKWIIKTGEGGPKYELNPKYGRSLANEQKPIEDVIKDITKNKESATKFLKSAGIMDDNGELAEMYRSEQQPAEWSEEDKRTISEVIQLIEDGALHREEKDFYISRLKSLHLQSKPEWSEEDDVNLGDIKCALYDYYGEERAEELYNILQSLRPQPKQEWSEEDECYLNAIIEDYQVLFNYYEASRDEASRGRNFFPNVSGRKLRSKEKDVAFLKSLRPRLIGCKVLQRQI